MLWDIYHGRSEFSHVSVYWNHGALLFYWSALEKERTGLDTLVALNVSYHILRVVWEERGLVNFGALFAWKAGSR